MKPFVRPRLASLILGISIPAVLLAGSVTAGELEDLLSPDKDTAKLVDESATDAWNEVVDAFRRNDLEKARELGNAFLQGDYKTSPYQLLGVQVMLDLAIAENPTVTKDAALTGEMKRLMAERDALRAKHANLQAIISDADATINRLTNNRTRPVQAGTAAFRECNRASEQIKAASAELEAMKGEIEANKVKVGNVEVGANEKLKGDTLKLLGMLVEADEIEAAFAVTNVFTRVAGNDLDIAKKQQDVIRLREDQKQAEKIASVISGEIEPLIAVGKGEEAETRLSQMIAKVEASDQSDSVKRMTVAKLKALGMKVNSAKDGESRGQAVSANEMAEIGKRLDVLEKKLEDAQDFFGTLVRSIDGFSDFSSDFEAESDKEKVTASLREKVKSGVVSKEKVDNLIKAKSQHAGILREVEILQSAAPKLGVVQRGRLANLQETAKTALDLLKSVTP
jgi:hypothetical protein